MNVTRNIILTADGSKALSTINQVDGRIAAMSSPAGSIGKLSSVLKFAGVAAAVTATFSVITKNVLKFSGQLTKVDAQIKALFKDKNEVLSATKDLMASYDYTKVQTQQYLSTMAAKISDVVSEKNLAKASTGAIRVAQRISTVFGISLEQAMDVVARALQGQMKGLERYGIAIDRNVKGSLKILSSMEDATAKYEQVITSQKRTISWQLDNIRNTVNEKWKQIAEIADRVFAPVLSSLNDLISAIDVTVLDGATSAVKEILNGLSDAFAQLVPNLQSLWETVKGFTSIFQGDLFTRIESMKGNGEESIGILQEVIVFSQKAIELTGELIDTFNKTPLGKMQSWMMELPGLKITLAGIRITLSILNTIISAITSAVHSFNRAVESLFDFFKDILGAVTSMDFSKIIGAFKKLWDNLKKSFMDEDTMAYFDKAASETEKVLSEEISRVIDDVKIKVNSIRGVKEVEVDTKISTKKLEANVQQGVNQVFNNVALPMKKAEEAAKIANTIDLTKMTQQFQTATTSVDTFTEALKKLDLTRTIEESLQKMKASIETSLNDIGNLSLIKAAGETMNAAAIAFKAAVESFNANPQQEVLINEAKQTNTYLEQISRNLVGVNAFA